MDKVDYDKMFERTLAELEGKPRLLLHVCCAPCLAAALPRLGDKFDVTYWFYDPNIWPESEYDKRLSEVTRYLKESGAPGKLIAEKYDRSQYDRAVGDAKGGREHGEKCVRCCRDRVFAAARKAAELGCEWFTTTLTSGPLKSADMLNAAASEAAELYGVKALPSDFKKKGGNLRTKEDHVDGGINEYGVVFKVIRVVLIVILVGCVLLAALSGIMVALYSRRRARYIKTSGNFEYVIKYDRNGSDPKYASITGFTSAGRKKEVIDIPRVIDGIPVRCMGGKNDVDYGPTSTHYFVFENDVLKKMYVHSNIETICDNVFDKMTDLDIMLCANESIMPDDYADDVKTVYVYKTLY